MGYIETLTVGGREITNPGFRNTSVPVFLARQEAGIRNRHFLNSLWRTYPEKKPMYLREKALPQRIADNIPDRKEEWTRPLSGSALMSAVSYHDGIKSGKPVSKAVIAAVAQWFGLTPSQITGKSRFKYIVSARFVAMRLLHEMYYETGAKRFSYPMIGSFFGGRDHSTVIHAIKTFDDRARAYPEMIEAYEALREG